MAMATAALVIVCVSAYLIHETIGIVSSAQDMKRLVVTSTEEHVSTKTTPGHEAQPSRHPHD